MAKSKKTVIKTSMRHPWPRYVFGLIMLTCGILFALALLTPTGVSGSVLYQVRRTALGLFGGFAVLGALLLLFAGVKILTGLYHRVTNKDWVLLSLLFILGLTLVTLITRMEDTHESLLVYIRSRYYPQTGLWQVGLPEYLKYAFDNATGAVGMLLAYPLWASLGQPLSIILVVCAISGVLAALLLRPIRNLTNAYQSRQANRPGREYVSEEPVDWSPEEVMSRPVPVKSTPHRSAQVPVQPSYDEPIYGSEMAMGGKDEFDHEFIPVQSGTMYTEVFPQEPPSPSGNNLTDLDLLRYQVDLPGSTAPEEEKPGRNRRSKKTTPEEKPAEKKPESETPSPRRQPEKTPVSAPPPVHTPSADQGRPADSQITKQVLQGAKVVNTESAVPLTDERIAIPVRAELPPDNDENTALDGTEKKKSKIDISLKTPVHYTPPPISLLAVGKGSNAEDWAQEDQLRARKIEETLESFNVPCKVKQILHGPAITRFAIQIAQGIRVNKVTNIADNLALTLATRQVRVEAPIQGTNFIGIEVPNQVISNVYLREVLDSREMRAHPSPLAVGLGKDIAGTPVVCDLSKMPHLLIAGATGSGKSVCIHSIVCSITYRATPEQVRLIMIDPKQVELSVYNALPHLLIPVVTDVRKAAGALAWAVQEMTDRYHSFKENGVRNLEGYNRLHPEEKLPNIVIVIDEMADLMDVCKKEVEEYIRRLAALARAAGIYMVLATQRPSVDVITGVIKNNIPSRIAFAVSSGTDSRTILDQYGAEKLMGKGDMLYKPMGLSPSRVQGCFVSDEEVNSLMEYISRYFTAEYDENLEQQLTNAANSSKSGGGLPVLGGDLEEESEADASQDEMLPEAIQMALEDGQTSTSMLQRRLRIGYARAGRLVDEMEKLKVVSAQDGSKPRKTIMTREQYYELMGKKE